MRKIQPSDRLRKEIQTFFKDMGSAEDGAQALPYELVRLASTLMVQEGLEAEQADFVGRPHYQRGQGNGYRSGYKPEHVDTAEGRLAMDLPQVRDARQPFRSKLFELLKGDSEMLEQLASEMYARGLSTRDIEAAFTDERGVCLGDYHRGGQGVAVVGLGQEGKLRCLACLSPRPGQPGPAGAVDHHQRRRPRAFAGH